MYMTTVCICIVFVYEYLLLLLSRNIFSHCLWHKMQKLLSGYVKSLARNCKQTFVSECFKTKNLLMLVQNWKFQMSMAGNSSLNHMT